MRWQYLLGVAGVLPVKKFNYYTVMQYLLYLLYIIKS